MFKGLSSDFAFFAGFSISANLSVKYFRACDILSISITYGIYRCNDFPVSLPQSTGWGSTWIRLALFTDFTHEMMANVFALSSIFFQVILGCYHFD